jgi:glucokinase
MCRFRPRAAIPTFAARNEIEIELLRYLWKQLGGRVSFERVVSGMGLKNIYSFLRDDQGLEEPAWLKERMEAEDPNAVIGEVGEEGSSELCAPDAGDFRLRLWRGGGESGAEDPGYGGIYLGGGIAPKILKTMKSGMFMEAFTDKGRMSICWRTSRCG